MKKAIEQDPQLTSSANTGPFHQAYQLVVSIGLALLMLPAAIARDTKPPLNQHCN